MCLGGEKKTKKHFEKSLNDEKLISKRERKALIESKIISDSIGT